jgi:cell division protein FtsB
MRNLKKIWLHFWQLGFKKYVLVLALGVLLVGFIGESSVLAHIRNANYISKLEGERNVLETEYARLRDEIYKLKQDPKAAERAARELYFMHADDEDVFVLSDDPQKPVAQP